MCMFFSLVGLARREDFPYITCQCSQCNALTSSRQAGAGDIVVGPGRFSLGIDASEGKVGAKNTPSSDVENIVNSDVIIKLVKASTKGTKL